MNMNLNRIKQKKTLNLGTKKIAFRHFWQQANTKQKI
jgi:hypothetical protein